MNSRTKPPASRTPRVTAADVARLSGVSNATVSYVLNEVDGQTIPASTRERVRAAAATLGYVPSAAAASLRRGHSRIVLVVTEPSLSGFATEPFLASIEEKLNEAQYTPINHGYRGDAALLSLVAEIRPYGVLSLAALTRATMSALAEAGVPRVYSSSQGDPGYIRPWEAEIGALQARYLIETGVDELVYASPLGENPRSVMARSRMSGVVATAADAGLPEVAEISLGSDIAAASAALRPVLASGRRIGICAFDDEVAASALAACHALGVRIPAEVAILGVENTPFSALFTPPLSTVAIDGRSTGRLVAERFLTSADPSHPTEVSHARAELVIRATT